MIIVLHLKSLHNGFSAFSFFSFLIFIKHFQFGFKGLEHGGVFEQISNGVRLFLVGDRKSGSVYALLLASVLISESPVSLDMYTSNGMSLIK